MTVVTAHAPVAPDKPEKEERARSIQPRHRLNPRTIDFKIAAVRTALQPNSKHETITLYFTFVVFVGGATSRNVPLLDHRNGPGLPRTVSLALGSVLLRWGGNTALSYSSDRPA
jgi:hypothetical protein